MFTLSKTAWQNIDCYTVILWTFYTCKMFFCEEQPFLHNAPVFSCLSELKNIKYTKVY